ncbi:MAG TPA: glycerophosphodiester phosphodiesterase family protein [Leptospiraceae bacterium]|nr:glycerophosphodiester phosphodiesterase family protein [Leptospiraceae bacterium]
MKSRKRIIAFLILLTILLTTYFYLRTFPIPILPVKSSLAGGEFRIAHRCGKRVLPENTLFACGEIFHKNLADLLEMDVHLTKDSHLIVIHDSSVDRTTNGKGKVAELNYEEIKNLDAGYTFTEDGVTFPYRSKGISILELEEFFKELPKAKYYIEVKVKEPLAAEILIGLINKYQMQERVYIGSARDGVNENLRKLSNHKIPVFSGLIHSGKWYLAYLLGIRGIVNPPEVMAIPDMPHLLPITDDFMKAIKEQNITLHIFTINNKDQIIKLKAMGLDGVMTDNPDLFSQD